MASLDSAEIQRLTAQNQALSEELAQCQADKEFVWSLWKRLQVANPDLSQAISMVVQREKEKAEMKDRKILEILHAKDDRIAALEELLAEQDNDKKDRGHDRTSELAELQEQVTTLQQELEQEIQAAEQKIAQHQEETQDKLNEKNSALAVEATEKEALKARCNELQSTVADSETQLQGMQQLNNQYEAKVQELQIGLEDVVKKAKLASQELDKKTESLVKARRNLQELTAQLQKNEQDLQSMRLGYEELKGQHDQAVQHASQQAELIHQLRALQTDTHKVLKNQEQAHTLESSSFQKMYQELRVHHEKLLISEKELKQRLVKVEGQVTSKPPMRNVSLQVNLDKGKGQRSRSQSREQVQLDHREDLSTEYRYMRSTSEDYTLHDQQTISSDRATSTPVKQTAARRARSLSPSQGRRGPEGLMSAAHSQGRISDFLDVSHDHGGRRNARKNDDLRRLLKLKNQEVDELRKAHSRRLDRLRTLQSAYDIVKEQIKTYEQEESDKKKKKKVMRSDAKDLRREDSDGVWNELAYYKQQTANLSQEKMNIEEEIDRLRVQAAVDASTIEDLTKCLENEKQGLEAQLSRLTAANRREEREKARAEDLYEKNKRLQKSLQALQSQQSERTEEEKKLERQLRSMKAELVQAKTAVAHKEVEHQALMEEVSKLRHKMRSLSESVRLQEAREQERQHFGDEDQISGIHIILHEEDEAVGGTERSRGSDSEEEEEEEIHHSSPLRFATKRSRSMSPPRHRSFLSSTLKSKTRSKSHTRPGTNSRSRTNTPNQSSMSRSHIAESPSPSKRQLMSVLHHFDRMAKAYEEVPPVYETLLMSVATQTERVVFAESGMMTESDSSGTINSSSTEGAIFPGIKGVSPIGKRVDMATSPIKSFNVTGLSINKKAAKSKTRGQSPGPSAVGVLKRRIGALQQQVASLQEQRQALQRAAVEHKDAHEAVQSDLNLANARHHNAKITIQRLTREVEEVKTRKDLLEAECADLAKQQKDKHSGAEWKSAEARIKSQASEIIRQGGAIKAMKAESDGKNETIKTLESRIQHLDRDLSQKRSLIEDLRARAKSANASDKIHSEAVEMLETRIAGLTETLDKRKVEIDSLRKRVAVVTKEKHHYENQSDHLQQEVDKKAAVLKDATSKLSEAEITISEIEATASQQFQILASQSELALDAAHVKIKQLQSRIRDLESFIQDLAITLSSQTQTVLDQALQQQSSRTAPAGPGPDRVKEEESMLKARNLASSILDMSPGDLDQFMEVERQEEADKITSEEETRRAKDNEWKKKFQTALNSQKFPRKQLKELIMTKLNERDDALSLARESR